jgi:hypothetical protein
MYVTITQQQVSLEQGQFTLQRDEWVSAQPTLRQRLP